MFRLRPRSSQINVFRNSARHAWPQESTCDASVQHGSESKAGHWRAENSWMITRVWLRVGIPFSPTLVIFCSFKLSNNFKQFIFLGNYMHCIYYIYIIYNIYNIYNTYIYLFNYVYTYTHTHIHTYIVLTIQMSVKKQF